MNQKCLYCQKEFEAKTDKRKFCSDSCRVMNHRKNGKKGTVTKMDVQVLFNEFKAAIQELGKIHENRIEPLPKERQADYYNATHPDQFTKVEEVKVPLDKVSQFCQEIFYADNKKQIENIVLKAKKELDWKRQVDVNTYAAEMMNKKGFIYND